MKNNYASFYSLFHSLFYDTFSTLPFTIQILKVLKYVGINVYEILNTNVYG